MDYFILERWSPYFTGAAIGILSWFTFLLSKKPIGCSTAFARSAGMIEKLFRGKKVEENQYFKEFPPVIDWEVMFVAGIVIGSFISAVISGNFEISFTPALWSGIYGDSFIFRLIAAFAGGIFLGFGARWSGGCTSGHGISGAMQMAVSGWVSAIFFFAGGVTIAHLIY